MPRKLNDTELAVRDAAQNLVDASVKYCEALEAMRLKSQRDGYGWPLDVIRPVQLAAMIYNQCLKDSRTLDIWPTF